MASAISAGQKIKASVFHKTNYILNASGWKTTSAPYTYRLVISGITAEDDQVEVGLAIPASYTATQAKAAKKAYGFITRAEAVSGAIVFYCIQPNKYPTCDIPIYVKGI